MNGWVRPTGAKNYHFFLRGNEESTCGNWHRQAMPAPVSEVKEGDKCLACAQIERNRKDEA